MSVNLFAEEPVKPVPKKPEPLKLTAGWGTIHGQVLFDGEPIQLPPLVKEWPGIPDPIPDESLLIDPKTGGLANVVVYLRRKRPSIRRWRTARSRLWNVWWRTCGCFHTLSVFGRIRRSDSTFLMVGSTS